MSAVDLRCRFCKRSLRGIEKMGEPVRRHKKFTERFNRKCPKSPDGACWRETVTTATAGSGKSKINIVFDDAAVPSRGASLDTRARWGSECLKRFFTGQQCNKKSIDLSLKWIDEAIERWETR